MAEAPEVKAGDEPLANFALRSLDDLAQSPDLHLTKDQQAAIDFARHAILRERDKFAPTPKVWENGDFLLLRQRAHGRHPRSLTRFIGGGRMPRFRHKTREAAETEAARLLAAHPYSTFVVLQEIGRVKLTPTEQAEAA